MIDCPYCEAPARDNPILEDDDGNPMCADCFASGFNHVSINWNEVFGFDEVSVGHSK